MKRGGGIGQVELPTMSIVCWVDPVVLILYDRNYHAS
jgi:hypothetical protein